MRATQLLISAGVAFAVMTAPANAAWHSYISHQLGFEFQQTFVTNRPTFRSIRVDFSAIQANVAQL